METVQQNDRFALFSSKFLYIFYSLWLYREIQNVFFSRCPPTKDGLKVGTGCIEKFKMFFSRCPPTKDGLKEGTDREEKFMYIPDCQKDQEYTQYLSGYEEYLE